MAYVQVFLSISTIGTYVSEHETKKGEVRKVETKTLAAYYIGSSGIDACMYIKSSMYTLVELQSSIREEWPVEFEHSWSCYCSWAVQVAEGKG